MEGGGRSGDGDWRERVRWAGNGGSIFIYFLFTKYILTRNTWKIFIFVAHMGEGGASGERVGVGGRSGRRRRRDAGRGAGNRGIMFHSVNI